MDTHAHEPAIRVSMLPRDTNAHGTIFGGVLLAYIDQAGAIATRPHCDLVVTVKMNEVVFHEPVYVGDLVSFYARIVRVGTTSITVKVEVTAERWRQPRRGQESDRSGGRLRERRRRPPARADQGKGRRRARVTLTSS
jgi:acyl-CoA thioesterase YciA